MSPIVAAIFTVDRIIGSSLFESLAQVLCARTGKSNFHVARLVLRSAVLLLFISLMIQLGYGLLFRSFILASLPLLVGVVVGRILNYEFQKLRVVETEMKNSLEKEDPLSQVLLRHWWHDRIRRTVYFGLAFGVVPAFLIEHNKLDLGDISFILLSIFLLTWSFYFYVLYHPLSVPS